MKHIKIIFVLFAFVFSACTKEGFAPAIEDVSTNPGPGTITYTNTSPAYIVNTVITQNVPTVTGGGEITSWSIDPSLSAATGLDFNTSTGVISGTPTLISHPGVTYTITAQNEFGTSNFSMTIVTNTTGVAPTISYSGTYTYRAGETLVSPITPSLGGGAPTSCTSSPALPAGLVLNPTTCAISGTPTSTVSQQLFTITATNATGSGSGTVNIGVIAIGAENIALTGVTQFTTSACALFNLTARDIFGNPSPVSANTVFSLSGAGNGGNFFSDSACTTTVTSVSIASGSSGTVFYYRKSPMGTATLSATLTSPASPALGNATINVNVATSTPARYGVVIPATGTTVSCNSVAINVLDASDNSVPTNTARTINLSGTASASFFSDANCTAAISSVALASGATSITAYMRKTSAGASTVTASSTGMANGSGSITIAVAPAQRIIFSAVAAIPFPASTCQSYTLQSRDSLNNNNSNVTTDTIVNLSGASDGSFYSNSTCTPANQITSTTLTSGSSSKVIYYLKPTSTAVTPGANITLTAAVAGWTPNATATVNVSTGNTINLATANAAVGISVSTASAVTAANKCLMTTVRVQDELGALVPTSKVTSPIVANLSGGGSGAQFWSNSTCTTPTSTVTISAGNNTGNFYYSSTAITAATPISWSNGGLGGSGGSRNVTVSSGVPSRMTWTTAPTTFNTNSCQTFTVNVRDPNTVTAIGANVSAATDFGLSDGSDGQFFSTAGCANPISTIQIAANAQAATFYYRKATASSATVSVALQSPLNPTIADLTRAVTVTVPAPVPNNILITASPSSSLVATQSCSALTLQSRSGSTAANVTANATFTLSGTNGANFYYDSGCTAVASPISLTILNGTSSISGLYVKTANVGTITISGTGSITVNNLNLTYSAPQPTRLDLAGPILMNAVTTCGSYTVMTQDAGGVERNVSANKSISLVSTGAAAVQFYSDASCSTAVPSDQVTVTSGSSRTTFYVRGDTAGAAEIKASSAGLTDATHSLTVQ